MDSKLDKILKELEELLDDTTSKEEKEKKEIETKKREIIESIQNSKDLTEIIYTDSHRTIINGKTNKVLALLSMTIDNLKDSVPFKYLAEACIAGLALKNDRTMDRDKLNEILEVMKKYI